MPVRVLVAKRRLLPCARRAAAAAALFLRNTPPRFQRRFVAGDELTIADIMLMVALDFAQRMELGTPPHVQRWYDEVSARDRASA